ncbi:MAG: NuoM family protein [Actinomycetes bacterium]
MTGISVLSALVVAVLVLPAAGALVLLLAGQRADAWAQRFGVVVTAAALAVSVALAAGFDRADPRRLQGVIDTAWVPQLGLRFHLGVDGISLPLVVLTTLLTALCAAYTVRHLPDPGRPRALVGLLLLLEVGLLGTFLAQDLLLFFVFFEVVLAPMYFVIAVWGGHGRVRAATTFILYTVLGSVVMLLGFLLVWARTGTTDFVLLSERGGAGMSRTVQLVAILAIGVGLAVKAPMWPLHSWLPDAHTAAPTVGSVLLAGVLLKMGTYGMVRIAVPVLPQGASAVAPYLGALGVVGIVYGSLACLAQRDLKRLVAFSSVGHMGFVLLGIATLTPIGLNGALYANVAHGVITGLLFFLVGGVKDRYGTTDLGELPRSLYARAPRLGGLVALAAVASLGLPGLAGFWGEFLAMAGAFRPAAGLHRSLFLVLLGLAAAGTVLTAYYLLRVVRRVDQGDGTGPPVRDVDAAEATAWLPLAALAVLLGVLPGVLLGLSDPVVTGLLGVGR